MKLPSSCCNTKNSTMNASACIYPHVVGGSVGLPSIWVLVAVTVGGSLMGIVGMLIFIPLMSVLYTLLRQDVIKRLEKKQLDIS